MLTQQLEQYSANLQRQGLHRNRHLTEPNESVVHFNSNDYLSLSTDPRIKKAYQYGFEHYPSGSGGSMVVCGYHAMHKELERAFAEALNVDACLLFSSGYVANLSIIGLLARFDAHILIDKMVHASTYDGLQLSNAHFSRYLHNNLADIATKFEHILSKTTVLMTEGTFSMSGQNAPLAEIAHWGRSRLQGLLVDEAHSFGVLGHQGLGAVIHHQLTQQEVPLRVIPLGKAYAGCGAIVAGHGAWIDALLQSSRPYIYSTAISPAYAYGLLETLAILREADDRRAKLNELVQYFRQAIRQSSLTWRDSSSPIQQLQLGCPNRALSLTNRLQEQSIICSPMRQPTVNKRETGLRIVLNYHHQPEHIDSLFRCLHQL